MYLKVFVFLFVFGCLGLTVQAQPTATLQITPSKGNPPPTFESKLPYCRGNEPKTWNLCVGTFTFPNGNSYIGEWRNGQRDGVGKIRIVARGKSYEGYIGSEAPSIYTGEFKNNMLNGRGVWIVDGGDRYEGIFSNNILVRVDNEAVNIFGNDSSIFRKKCETYGLQFGTADFANCMIKLEQLNAKNAQADADRSQRERESQRQAAQRESESQREAAAAANQRAIDGFRAMGEIAKPQWIQNQCPQMLNARPGQYPGCN